MTGRETPSSACTRRPDEISADGFSSKIWPEQLRRGAAARGGHDGGGGLERREAAKYLCDPQWFRDTASRGPTTIVAPESQFRTCPSDHDNIGYPRMSASGESSTTMHRLLHASGSHPIPSPNDPKSNRWLDVEHRAVCVFAPRGASHSQDSCVQMRPWLELGSVRLGPAGPGGGPAGGSQASGGRSRENEAFVGGGSRHCMSAAGRDIELFRFN
ncbi:hypothetical protein F511_17805 [Dorcoceras hygrometricum]|uniref:Uncharacterized protein n=1 Tax=Dorcoceras hygrometricum TaxID=472368 RepID=A0A2Z7B2D3_9LAMI|nr:hypothetical protein F511_17805 [Dorcoceras hygrometricum]